MALGRRHAAVQPQVGHRGQFGFQQVLLYDVQHALQLTENQHAVLGHHRLGGPLGPSAAAQTAVQQQLKLVRTTVWNEPTRSALR